MHKLVESVIILAMNTLIHADIFFFIGSIWMIAISAVVLVIFWNIARILNDVRHISRKVREGSEVLSEDLREWRTAVRAQGVQFKHVVGYFKNLFVHRRNHKK